MDLSALTRSHAVRFLLTGVCLRAVNFRRVNLRQNLLLKDALQDVHLATEPIVIEIEDSFTHTLDLADVDLAEETVNEDGGLNLKLGNSLLIRAASNQRPIIELTQPLRFVRRISWAQMLPSKRGLMR